MHEVIRTLQQSLPSDIKAHIIIDQADFIKASIHNIRHAIIEAIVLVLLIVFLLLRNIRATLIPLITIPISLLGSLLFLKFFGFSLNLMTLLAMVLAIGLVVDDAIVVLENIWRHIEEGMSSMDAAVKGAREISFAIAAMTLTLVSVYVPIAFIPGMLGQFFIEFAVALAGSVLISGLVALTLSPLMCGHFLNKNTTQWWPIIDIYLARLTTGYATLLLKSLRYRKTTLFIGLASIVVSIGLYHYLTYETAPKEDRGLIGIFIPPVAGENIDILDKKIASLEQKIQGANEYASQLTFIGDWGGSVVLPLKPHTQRRYSASDMVERINPLVNHYPSIDPHVWNWDTGLPGLDEAGSSSDLALVISSSESFQQLADHMRQLKKILENSKQFGTINFDLQLDTMGYTIDLDYNQLAKLGLTAEQAAKMIEIFFSGDKSQTFEKEGIIYNLTIKGAASPWTLDELYLTTPLGRRVSLGAITKMIPTAQPASLGHFQQMRAVTLYAAPLPGDPIANSAKKLWSIVKNNLPPQYRLTWTGIVKTLQESSHTMIFLLLLSLVFICAVLAVQFENFVDPVIILFTAPLACVGALISTVIFGQTLNIYTQVGLITLIGLVSKHGILIVEFANQLKQEGLDTFTAIQQASILRLRPILMTTGAMVFGAIPLIISHDAGAEARRAIGTVLVGGLCLGTFFTLFVLPAVYQTVKSWKTS